MKIIVTSPSFSKNKTLQKEIYKHFPNAKLNVEGQRFNQDELIEYIKDGDGVIVGLEPINQKVLDSCPNLKIMSKYTILQLILSIENSKQFYIWMSWSISKIMKKKY